MPAPHVTGRGARRRLAEGCFDDRFGRSAVVKVGRLQREHRFSADTPLEILKSWRVQMRAELDSQRQGQRLETLGTLPQDAKRFLKRKEGLVGYKAEVAHLRAWFPLFGLKLRTAITKEAVANQIAQWRQADVAARTIRHRCRVLRECFHVLDGPKARTPLDDLKLPPIPVPQPTAVPVKMIQAVAKNLKRAGLRQDYARFLVRATTGQRPAQIMRATPDDLDWKRRIWFVRPAKGGKAIPLPLNPEMVEAWKVFAKADAWGPFDTAVAAEVLRAHGWPRDVRPYALRSTFAIDLLLSGTDIGDLQGLLGHTQIQTTRSYYAPVITARLLRAVSKRKLGLG